MSLADYPVIIDVSVAWGEMDAFGHVNNIVYFRYFESARIAYFDTIGFRDPDANHGVAPILASTHCRFRKPLTYPAAVRVGARIVELVNDRFTMEYRMVDAAETVIAEGGGVVVAYDYRAGQKAPVPDAVRARVRALETGPGFKG